MKSFIIQFLLLAVLFIAIVLGAALSLKPVYPWGEPDDPLPETMTPHQLEFRDMTAPRPELEPNPWPNGKPGKQAE
jgi:hypothetical protein